MRREWLRRGLAYGALVFVVAGTLYQMKNTAVEVDFTVDLIGVRALDGTFLNELRVEFYEEDGTWVSATVYRYPEDLYPDGPPSETRSVELGLVPGTYEVSMTRLYGSGEGARVLERRVAMTVEQKGAVRLRAAP